VGISTLCMTSALDITEAVNPPRAAFLDYPLGHTTGKPDDPELQRAILVDALAAFDRLSEPGSVRVLPFRWSDDDAWKAEVERGADVRLRRTAEPQYQCERDRELAEAAPSAAGPGAGRH
jgi:hypothetical protein